jgi:hypothetical protein
MNGELIITFQTKTLFDEVFSKENRFVYSKQ